MDHRKIVARTLVRAERVAAALPPLLLQAERVAATVVQGTHGRRRTGLGDQFWEFRPYRSTDPVGRIDWRQTAKRDMAFVREREWAAAQTAMLWCASDPGMEWRSQPSLPTKGDRARLLALALASLLLQGGERVGLLTPQVRPGGGRATLHRLAVSLAAPDFLASNGEDLPRSALPLPSMTPILFGDFLRAPEEVAEAVRSLSARAKGHLVQILDPAEETLPYGGRMVFTSVSSGEGGRDLWPVSRVEDIRPRYVERLRSHRRAIQAVAEAYGWSYTVHRTDSPPGPALLTLHQTVSAAFRRER